MAISALKNLRPFTGIGEVFTYVKRSKGVEDVAEVSKGAVIIKAPQKAPQRK